MNTYELRYELAGALKCERFSSLDDALRATKGLAAPWDLRHLEECRRCGEAIEKDEPETRYVCEDCFFKDWEEAHWPEEEAS